jgi:hypothetical protein
MNYLAGFVRFLSYLGIFFAGVAIGSDPKGVGVCPAYLILFCSLLGIIVPLIAAFDRSGR